MKFIIVIFVCTFAFDSIASDVNTMEVKASGVLPEPVTTGLIGAGLLALAVGANTIRKKR